MRIESWWLKFYSEGMLMCDLCKTLSMNYRKITMRNLCGFAKVKLYVKSLPAAKFVGKSWPFDNYIEKIFDPTSPFDEIQRFKTFSVRNIIQIQKIIKWENLISFSKLDNMNFMTGQRKKNAKSFSKKIKMNINLLFIFPYNFVVVCLHAKYFMYFFHLQHGTRCIFCEKKIKNSLYRIKEILVWFW